MKTNFSIDFFLVHACLSSLLHTMGTERDRLRRAVDTNVGLSQNTITNSSNVILRNNLSDVSTCIITVKLFLV